VGARDGGTAGGLGVGFGLGFRILKRFPNADLNDPNHDDIVVPLTCDDDDSTRPRKRTDKKSIFPGAFRDSFMVRRQSDKVKPFLRQANDSSGSRSAVY
jgi:hypothetical protein